MLITNTDNVSFLANALISGNCADEVTKLIDKLNPYVWNAEEEKDKLADIAEAEDTDEAWTAYEEAYKYYKHISDYIEGINLLAACSNYTRHTTQIDEAVNCARDLETEYGINFYRLFK